MDDAWTDGVLEVWETMGTSRRSSSSAPSSPSFSAASSAAASQVAATPPPPSVKCAHSMVHYRRALYSFGGFDGVRDTQDLYKFDLVHRQWSVLPTAGDQEQVGAFPPLLFPPSISIFPSPPQSTPL